MSRNEDLEVLEIGEVFRTDDSNFDRLVCNARAEWRRGSGYIEYGAHISENGSIILEYRQD